jgi:hypothetical protein
VFVPGISEFRAVKELERWFGDDAPLCDVTGCCGRRLTNFSRDEYDLGVLAAHNAMGWLAIVEDLVACPPGDRTRWLGDHHVRVAAAYAELRARTGVRDIRPYGSARVWSRLNDH